MGCSMRTANAPHGALACGTQLEGHAQTQVQVQPAYLAHSGSAAHRHHGHRPAELLQQRHSILLDDELLAPLIEGNELKRPRHGSRGVCAIQASSVGLPLAGSFGEGVCSKMLKRAWMRCSNLSNPTPHQLLPHGPGHACPVAIR